MNNNNIIRIFNLFTDIRQVLGMSKEPITALIWSQVYNGLILCNEGPNDFASISIGWNSIKNQWETNIGWSSIGEIDLSDAGPYGETLIKFSNLAKQIKEIIKKANVEMRGREKILDQSWANAKTTLEESAEPDEIAINAYHSLYGVNSIPVVTDLAPQKKCERTVGDGECNKSSSRNDPRHWCHPCWMRYWHTLDAK